MIEWISVDEEMPEDSHEQILLWNGKFPRLGLCLGSVKYKQLCFYTVHEQMLHGITHWAKVNLPKQQGE